MDRWSCDFATNEATDSTPRAHHIKKERETGHAKRVASCDSRGCYNYSKKGGY